MFQHFRLSLLTIAAMASLLALPCQAGLPSFGLDGEPMPSLAPLLEKVNPAVVNISTHSIKTVRNPSVGRPVFSPFFFKRLKGRFQPSSDVLKVQGRE